MILVDRLRVVESVKLPVKEWCHMVSDTSLEELHAMASAMGLPARAFHKDHYDLTPPRRKDALRLGAASVTSKELVLRMVPSRRLRRSLAPRSESPSR
jgi:hypothetical protein